MTALAPVLRWTPGRKAALVQAIANGAASRDEAMRSYNFTPEELERLIELHGQHGRNGLRITRQPRELRA